MAKLEGLPNEVTLNIFAFVLPADLENFATTCKHLHRLAESGPLPEHRLLKKLHTTWNFTRNPVTYHDRLRMIQQDPHWACYVKEIAIIDRTPWLDSWGPKHVAIFNQSLLDRLSRATIMTDAGIVDCATWISSWKDAINDDNEYPILTVLLMLLPNLTKLSLGYVGEDPSTSLREMLSSMTYIDRPKANTLPTQPCRVWRRKWTRNWLI